MNHNQYLTELAFLFIFAELNSIFTIILTAVYSIDGEQNDENKDDPIYALKNSSENNYKFLTKMGKFEFILGLVMIIQMISTFSIQQYKLMKFTKYFFQYPLQKFHYTLHIFVELLIYGLLLTIFVKSETNIGLGIIQQVDLLNTSFFYTWIFIIFSFLMLFPKSRNQYCALARIISQLFLECKTQLIIFIIVFIFISIKGSLQVIFNFCGIKSYIDFFTFTMEIRGFFLYLLRVYQPTQINTTLIDSSQISVAKWKENVLTTKGVKFLKQAAKQKFYIMSRKLVSSNRSLNHLDNWKKLDSKFNFAVQNIKYCNFPENKSSGEVLVNSFLSKDPKFVTVQLIEKFSEINISQYCIVNFLNTDMKIIKTQRFNNFGARHFNFNINQNTLHLVKQDIKELTIFDLKKNPKQEIKLKIEFFNYLDNGYQPPVDLYEQQQQIDQMFVNNSYFDTKKNIRSKYEDSQQNNNNNQDNNNNDQNNIDQREKTFKPILFFNDESNYYIVFGLVVQRQDLVVKQQIRNLFCCKISIEDFEQHKNKINDEHQKSKNDKKKIFNKNNLVMKIQCDVIWRRINQQNLSFKVQQFSTHEVIIYEQNSKKMYIYDCLNRRLSPIVIVGLRCEYITDLHFYSISQYLSELGFVSCSVVFQGRIHAYSLIYKGEIIYISNASQCDLGHSQDFRFILIEHVNALRMRPRRGQIVSGLIYKTSLIDIKKIIKEKIKQKKQVNQQPSSQNHQQLQIKSYETEQNDVQNYNLSNQSKKNNDGTIYLRIND